LDLDSDNDKIDDKTETAIDTDKDGKPNYIDTDSDNDGITDLVETTIDTDKDGIPNYLDPDSDGDGIADKFEGTKDTDNDGRPDYLDLDSDNDGYSDADERGITSLDQAPLDTDKDGLADYIDTDSDGDGILDKVEDDINLGNLPDCDKDGISNRLDKDICDLLKPRGISPNGDGKNDFLIIPGILRYEPNHLMIYNRWGTLVYETKNYQNNWAGTDNKGVDLPDGTYYYLIDFFGKRPEISTYVYINRAN
jgi:gliding motility-associated-like protein